MTVSTEVSREEYTGNGVTTDFDYRFRVFSAEDLVVSVADTTETITVLTLNTDYTVTGAGSRNGGKVKLSSPLAFNWRISIERALPVTQETDIRNQGNFFPEVHEDAFDKLTMLIQQVWSYFGLALRKPTWLAKFYDALGNRIANLGNPVNSQDAATKSYVDAGDATGHQYADDLFKRTLRVPENSIQQLPSASARRNKILAFDSAGNPLPVLPESGSAADVLIELAKPDGTALVAGLGNSPLIAVSHFKNKGLSDQEAVQAAFDSGLNIFFDIPVTLTDYITKGRSTELNVMYSPNATVTGHGYLPVLRTNPAHVVGGTTFRQYKTRDPNGGSYARVYSHQTLTAEMSVHDVTIAGVSGENFVSLYSGIETFNCERQRIWAFNSVTNAHGITAGDEIYGYEADMNADGTVNSGGQFVGVYVAGIGDVSNCANSDGIRVQRIRNGVDKWNYGIRVFDSVTGLSIVDAKTYSIFAEGAAPFVRRKTTQDGGWSIMHQLSSSVILWGVDDYGDIYVHKLFIGSGNGKSKKRVNLDGGVTFHTTNAAVVWGQIPAGGYSEKDVTTLFGITTIDWSASNVVVTPAAYAGSSIPNVSVQVFYNSSKTQAYVRVSNIGTSNLSECNIGLNAMLTTHALTN